MTGLMGGTNMRDNVFPYREFVPDIAPDVFVAPTAQIIGNVTIGSGSSIWFGVVLRGDVEEIRIGRCTNVQDGSIVHVKRGKAPTHIGSDITIGHGAILHGCTLEDECFIGMGALVLDDAVVESGAMIGPGSLVPEGRRITSGKLWAGVPVRPLRDLTDEDFSAMAENISHYTELGREYAATARFWPTERPNAEK
jgi:gamma-carbonic anhydrase